ncbi:hypothetical protein L9F63_001154, partial [Diploptera punctata]
ATNISVMKLYSKYYFQRFSGMAEYTLNELTAPLRRKVSDEEVTISQLLVWLVPRVQFRAYGRHAARVSPYKRCMSYKRKHVSKLQLFVFLFVFSCCSCSYFTTNCRVAVRICEVLNDNELLFVFLLEDFNLRLFSRNSCSPHIKEVKRKLEEALQTAETLTSGYSPEIAAQLVTEDPPDETRLNILRTLTSGYSPEIAV